MAGAACIPLRGVGPERTQVELLDGLLKAGRLVGNGSIHVKIIEIAFDVDVRPPGSCTRGVIDDQPRRIELPTPLVHLGYPDAVRRAERERGAPVLVHDRPDHQRRVIEVAPNHRF